MSLATRLFFRFVDSAHIIFSVTGVNVSATINPSASPTMSSLFLTGLKSGANQGAAGAAVNELWRDTADNTVKIGV